MKTSTHEEIASRAHAIWERAGRPEGQADDHWRQAESELTSGSRSVEKLEGLADTPKAAPSVERRPILQ